MDSHTNGQCLRIVDQLAVQRLAAQGPRWPAWRGSPIALSCRNCSTPMPTARLMIAASNPAIVAAFVHAAWVPFVARNGGGAGGRTRPAALIVSFRAPD